MVASRILLIRPTHFMMNKQAMETNHFVRNSETLHPEKVLQTALKEHNYLVRVLQDNSVDIVVYDGLEQDCPDEVFCNNWFSIHHPHESGKDFSFGVIYPMAVPNRRKEVREDILLDIQRMYDSKDVVGDGKGDGFTYYDLRDMEGWAFLEGTGSVVFDRQNRTMYAGLSPRTYFWKLLELKKALGYELVCFQTQYRGKPIYHTNVMMAIGREWAVVCVEVIVSESERKKVVDSLKRSGKKVIEIKEVQVGQFCGNVLEVVNREGKAFTVVSKTAYDAFTEEQRLALGELLVVPLETIERYGGGGVRCCLAEI